jgi:excisionase family DNA binding protein
LGVRDAASYLGLSPFTIRNMVKDKRLLAVAIPGVVRILIDIRDLDALIDSIKANTA